MQSTDTTAFMSELQKAVGGSGVIDNIMLARQGVKEAQAIVNQLRSMASSIPVDIYMGFPIPEPQNSQNKAAKQGILDSAIMIENCMVGIKRALNLVPTSNIPKPAAASELLKAYVNLLNEIPKIQDQFNKVS
ncbi:MAG TPA: hypothetical protein PK467_09930, partial [Candidatus Wallbacteria bacterium]|nr:hypothetical protein [Candidatus Wallbacteria bacterium]